MVRTLMLHMSELREIGTMKGHDDLKKKFLSIIDDIRNGEIDRILVHGHFARIDQDATVAEMKRFEEFVQVCSGRPGLLLALDGRYSFQEEESGYLFFQVKG